ncbi:MAG: cell division protein ZapA [Pseudomonadota bacterium]
MPADKVSVKVYIMNKEYQIQCGPDEKQRLIQAAGDVDNRMRQAKSSSISTEKAAVLTALNLANELQDASQTGDILNLVSSSIIDMNSRIDKVLDKEDTADNTLSLSAKHNGATI